MPSSTQSLHGTWRCIFLISAPAFWSSCAPLVSGPMLSRTNSLKAWVSFLSDERKTEPGNRCNSLKPSQISHPTLSTSLQSSLQVKKAMESLPDSIREIFWFRDFKTYSYILWELRTTFFVPCSLVSGRQDHTPLRMHHTPPGGRQYRTKVETLLTWPYDPTRSHKVCPSQTWPQEALLFVQSGVYWTIATEITNQSQCSALISHLAQAPFPNWLLNCHFTHKAKPA